MAIKPIVIYPDPVLREISQKIGKNLDGINDLVRDMSDSMYSRNGAGFAAIQIGVPKRIFIIDSEIAGKKPEDPLLVFIDPEITYLSNEKEIADEGCLSFPGIYVPVERSIRARTKARDLNGEIFEIEGESLFARAMQHEYDHLNGKLLADFVGRIKRNMIKRRLEREELEEEAEE